MAYQDKNNTRFIRKNGRIIPIKGKKGSGPAPKKRAKRKSKSEVKAGQRRQATNFAIGAGVAGGLAGANNATRLLKGKKMGKVGMGLMGVSAALGVGSLVQNVRGSESFLGGAGNILLDSAIRGGVGLATAGASLGAGTALSKLAKARRLKMKKGQQNF